MLESDIAVAYMMGMWTIGMIIATGIHWRINRLYNKFLNTLRKEEE